MAQVLCNSLTLVCNTGTWLIFSQPGGCRRHVKACQAMTHQGRSTHQQPAHFAFCVLQGSPEGSIQLQLSLLAHEVKGQPELAASSEARLEAALGEAAQGQVYQTGGPGGPQCRDIKAACCISWPRGTARCSCEAGGAAQGQLPKQVGLVGCSAAVLQRQGHAGS